MRLTRLRLTRLVAGVGLAVLVSAAGSACTTHAGAAAQVGSDTIETSQLRDVVSRGLAASAAAPAELTSQIQPGAVTPARVQQRALTGLVQYQLLSDEAKRRGITLTDASLSGYFQTFAVLQYGSVRAFREQMAAAAIDAKDLDLIIRTGALQSAISDQVSPTLVASDAETRSAYDRSQSLFGRLPLTYAQAKPYLARLMVTEERADALRPVLASAEQRDPISVNPRFGRWDTTQFSVIAADGSVATRPAPTATVDLTSAS